MYINLLHLLCSAGRPPPEVNERRPAAAQQRPDAAERRLAELTDTESAPTVGQFRRFVDSLWLPSDGNRFYGSIPYRPQTISTISISATDKFGYFHNCHTFSVGKVYFGHRSDHIGRIKIGHRQIRPHPYQSLFITWKNVKFGHWLDHTGQINISHRQISSHPYRHWFGRFGLTCSQIWQLSK